MNGHKPKANNQFDEMPEISALLREMPRVAAPANFDAQLKARLAAAQSEAREFADVKALLKELPRVAAPGNFNAQVMARIAEAKAEAQEFAGVASLLQEMPRVTAPADFDFKLRARIAQAKSEEQKSPFAWLSEIFNFSFSWAQAGAALAVVAFIVAGVTYNFMPAKPSAPITTVGDVAKNEIPSVVEKHEQVAESTKVSEVMPVPVARPRAISTGATIRPITVATSTGSKASTVAVPVAPVPENTNIAAAGTVMIRHTKDGSTRVINVSEYSLGQQAAFSQHKIERTSPNEIATQIY